MTRLGQEKESSAVCVHLSSNAGLSKRAWGQEEARARDEGVNWSRKGGRGGKFFGAIF